MKSTLKKNKFKTKASVTPRVNRKQRVLAHQILQLLLSQIILKKRIITFNELANGLRHIHKKNYAAKMIQGFIISFLKQVKDKNKKSLKAQLVILNYNSIVFRKNRNCYRKHKKTKKAKTHETCLRSYQEMGFKNI